MYLIFGLLIITGIFISGCTTRISDKVIEEPQRETIPSSFPPGGLGNLCSGEEECRDFCQNNRGQCESYCRGKNNKLCRIIFSDKDRQQTGNNVNGKENCVSNPNPVFTSAFTDNTKIRDISPIGGVALSNPGSSARSYVSMKPETANSGMVPVYAPVDSILQRITYANRNLGTWGIRPEYRLDFQVSCEVKYVFDHLADVADKVKVLAPKIPADSTQTRDSVSLAIHAGELVGYTNRNFIEGNWDFMVLNTANEEIYINPLRWSSEHSLYGVCPYNYFIPELKEKYYSLIQKPRNAEKSSCRTVSRDVPGTLAGGWFQGNSNENDGSRLVVASNINMVDFEIVRDNQQRFFARDTNGGVIMPETITVGKSVCYYDNEKNNYVYLKLLSEMEMGLAMGSGACPSIFPAEYEMWVR